MEMKKITLLAIVLTAGLLTMCSETEKIQPAATITIDPNTGSGKPSQNVSISIAYEAPNGASELHVFSGGVEVDLVSLSGKTSPTTYEYTVPADAAVGSNIVLGFQIFDVKGYPSALANFTITVGETLQGTISANRTLDATQQYIIKGQVFVSSGVKLTIPAGTILKGDKASKGVLIVQPGGQLDALGEANKPVVFISAQPVGARDRGDWGGVILLGNAFVNQPAKPAIEGITPNQTYGSSLAETTNPATNATENSGTIRYTRIEYAGIELTPNNETNGLTMGGVGNGTTIEFVQVSFGGDDSFEWFGGTVNCKNLVALSSWDDDFDTDFGWGGNVQFGLAVRNTFFADQSGSNGFESDNQGNGNTIAGICDGTTQAGCTRGVFSNMTILGPREIQSRTISANFQNGAHIRRRTSISIFNSYIAGFRIGIRLDDQGTLDNLTGGSGKHAYNVLSVPGTTRIGAATTASDANFATGLSAGDATAVATYWTNNSNTDFNNITTTQPHSDLGINAALFWGGSTSSTYPSNPDFRLIAGVAGANNLNGGANFGDAKLSGGFFSTTTYRGAFSSTTDWTDGWSEFQPLSKAY